MISGNTRINHNRFKNPHLVHHDSNSQPITLTTELKNCSTSSDVSPPSHYDVIVVGGGISGLTAANELSKVNRRVLVLEAQNRVGGRTHTLHIENQDKVLDVDVGGQWVAPTQFNIKSLLKELEIDTYQQHTEGHSVLLSGVYNKNKNKQKNKEDSDHHKIHHSSLYQSYYHEPHETFICSKFTGIVPTYTGNMIIETKELSRVSKEQDVKLRTTDNQSRTSTSLIMQFLSFIIGVLYWWLSLVDIQLTVWDIEKRMKMIDVQEPWNSQNAHIDDSMTVASYMNQRFWTQEAKDQFTIPVQAVFAADPGEISLLFFLFVVKCADGIDNLLYGAQDIKIKGGAQSVSLELLRRLQKGSNSCTVKLNSPVTDISNYYLQHCDSNMMASKNKLKKNQKQRIHVRTRDGTVYTCSRIILALPPTMSTRIHYDPPLPGLRDHLCQRMPMGSVIKINVLFNSFWWRELGYSGFFANSTRLQDHFPVKAGYDVTQHPGIVGFILARDCKYWGQKSMEQRRDAIIHQIATMFGVSVEHVEERVTNYVEKDWTQEEFNRGCYMAVAPPGTLTGCGRALRKPIGQMYFAGTETATEWMGYMDGAVQSGRRAAHEVIDSFL